MFSGGNGTDTISYSDATGGVTFSLAAALGASQPTAGAGNDTLIDATEVGGSAHLVENLGGSSFGDTLTGDGAANTIEGALGADALSALGGADTILARDGVGDTAIDCGGDGGDHAQVDALPLDGSVVGCATLDRPPTPATSRTPRSDPDPDRPASGGAEEVQEEEVEEGEEEVQEEGVEAARLSAAGAMAPRARAAVTAIFFLNGVVFGSWYARLPAIQDDLGLSSTEIGIALLGAPAGRWSPSRWSGPSWRVAGRGGCWQPRRSCSRPRSCPRSQSTCRRCCSP